MSNTTVDPQARAQRRPATAQAMNDVAPVHGRRNHRGRAVLLSIVVLIAGLGAAGWYFLGKPARVPPTSPTTSAPPKPAHVGHGRVQISPAAAEALGLTTTPVVPQTEPINLELLGTTKYDEDTLSRVRTMLKGRVDRVHATIGQEVKKGDPLVDLYSTELAEAKNQYEIAQIQWTYTKNLLENRNTLQSTGAIPNQLIRETQSNELRGRREYDVARDKLLVLGLTDQEIDKIADEVGQEKARFTLRAPADGLIIERNVAPGNLYDESDTLFVISTLDHLWVWGNVFESDLNLVQLGQRWDIAFPFLGRTIPCTVEYISNRVDPGTRAVRIRTSAPNPDGLLKSDMLVRGILKIPPDPKRTVIPRNAVVVAEGKYLAFVPVANQPGVYERRELKVSHEKDDYVVVDSGLNAGEDVVSTGVLYLSQVYDDLATTLSDDTTVASYLPVTEALPYEVEPEEAN